MGLIFSSLKTPFLMFVFCTFSMTLKHTDFHFFFEILDHMMGFSIFLCGDYMTGHLAMETLTAFEKVSWQFFGKFCHK